MTVACLVSAAGDALMSRGMRQVGDVSALGGQFWLVLRMFKNPLVWASVACSAAYFFLYSSALSWGELSATQPLNALTFVFAALLARFALHEHVPGYRWAGLLAIAIGVALVSMSPKTR
jgi:drug/metabolite transporter (DMT)-like permease